MNPAARRLPGNEDAGTRMSLEDRARPEREG